MRRTTTIAPGAKAPAAPRAKAPTAPRAEPTDAEALGIIPYEASRLRSAEWRLCESSRFLDDRGPVWDTLRAVARRLEDAGIPYAVFGALAVIAHGHRRVTTDIDVLVDAEARRRIHDLLDGRGYVPPFAGSRNLRDTSNGVKIDLVLAGEFPGTGAEIPVAFPDPSTFEPFVKDGVRYVTLEQLVELKLASGISHKLRYKDLGDVVSLIGSARLPRDLGERLHPWVREKWYEIWDGWEADPRKDMF